MLGGLLSRRARPESVGGRRRAATSSPRSARARAPSRSPTAHPEPAPEPERRPSRRPPRPSRPEPSARPRSPTPRRRRLQPLRPPADGRRPEPALGPPRATALGPHGERDRRRVRLTIAWELTWYQWEVAAGGAAMRCARSGKGDTIDQLARRRSNLEPDGRRRRDARGEALDDPGRGRVKLTVHVDGGSRGNPGPGSDRGGPQRRRRRGVDRPAQVIGRATNNVAEYRALIFGIERAAALGATELDLVGDSELIVKQVRGEYRVKEPNMKPLHAAVPGALADFDALVDPPRPARPQRRGRPSRQRGARRRPTRDPSPAVPGAPGVLYCRDRAAVAQLARASACHAEGRGFESHQPLVLSVPAGSRQIATGALFP